MVETPNILLVDDEPGVLFALKMLLSLLPAQVTTADSGESALALYSQQPFDLVISDLRMPELNGIQFFQKLKAKWPKVKFILISGHADEQDRKVARLVGITSFLAKPFSLEDIKNPLHLHLRPKVRDLSSWIY